MTRIRENYITLLMPEDLDEITEEDKLYLDTEEGGYIFYEKTQIQKDDDGLYFINNDQVKWLDYNEMDMYRIREKDYSWYFKEQKGDKYISILIIALIIIMFIHFVLLPIAGVKI